MQSFAISCKHSGVPTECLTIEKSRSAISACHSSQGLNNPRVLGLVSGWLLSALSQHKALLWSFCRTNLRDVDDLGGVCSPKSKISLLARIFWRLAWENVVWLHANAMPIGKKQVRCIALSEFETLQVRKDRVAFTTAISREFTSQRNKIVQWFQIKQICSSNDSKRYLGLWRDTWIVIKTPRVEVRRHPGILHFPQSNMNFWITG